MLATVLLLRTKTDPSYLLVTGPWRPMRSVQRSGHLSGVIYHGISKRCAEWLDGQRDAMTALLADLVNIDSGSYNKAGVDAVAARLDAHLEKAGILTSGSRTRTLATRLATVTASPAPTVRSC